MINFIHEGHTERKCRGTNKDSSERGIVGITKTNKQRRYISRDSPDPVKEKEAEYKSHRSDHRPFPKRN